MSKKLYVNDPKDIKKILDDVRVSDSNKLSTPGHAIKSLKISKNGEFSESDDEFSPEPNFFTRRYIVQKTVTSTMLNVKAEDCAFLSKTVGDKSNGKMFNITNTRLCRVHKVVGCKFNQQGTSVVAYFLSRDEEISAESDPTAFSELDDCSSCVFMSHFKNNFNLIGEGQLFTLPPPAIWKEVHFNVFLRIVDNSIKMANKINTIKTALERDRDEDDKQEIEAVELSLQPLLSTELEQSSKNYKNTKSKVQEIFVCLNEKVISKRKCKCDRQLSGCSLFGNLKVPFFLKKNEAYKFPSPRSAAKRNRVGRGGGLSLDRIFNLMADVLYVKKLDVDCTKSMSKLMKSPSNYGQFTTLQNMIQDKVLATRGRALTGTAIIDYTLGPDIISLPECFRQHLTNLFHPLVLLNRAPSIDGQLYVVTFVFHDDEFDSTIHVNPWVTGGLHLRQGDEVNVFLPDNSAKTPNMLPQPDVNCLRSLIELKNKSYRYGLRINNMNVPLYSFSPFHVLMLQRHESEVYRLSALWRSLVAKTVPEKCVEIMNLGATIMRDNVDDFIELVKVMTAQCRDEEMSIFDILKCMRDVKDSGATGNDATYTSSNDGFDNNVSSGKSMSLQGIKQSTSLYDVTYRNGNIYVNGVETIENVEESFYACKIYHNPYATRYCACTIERAWQSLRRSQDEDDHDDESVTTAPEKKRMKRKQN